MLGFSPHSQVHWLQTQGMEDGIAPLPITPSDPLAKFLFLSPTDLRNTSLEIPHSKERNASNGGYSNS